VLFNLESDSGDAVCGYFVPDNFEEIPRITFVSGGKIVYEGLTDHPREVFVVHGRHRTGLCGFAVLEKDVPGLSGMSDLAVHEKTTGTLIYKRAQTDHVPKRMVRLETHLLPLWRLDNVLNRRFQYSANRIEASGRETTTQLFNLSGVRSVYLSGRVLYRAFQHYIEGHFDVVFSMHHPYEELAERLIVMAQINRTGSAILGLRENMSLEPTMAYAQSLPLGDLRALGRALRDMPVAVAKVLANPVTRQLTTSTPEEMPGGRAVSSALTTLASFAVVGLRRAQTTFARAVEEFVGLDERLPTARELPGLTSLARLLKESREVEWLIEQDLVLYNHIADAYRACAPASLDFAAAAHPL